MIELSNERIEKILHEETMKTEPLPLLLRAVFNRYRQLYENYFADIDSLNEDKIAELRAYHEETKSLFKYYYMDIPLDVCEGLNEFEQKYSIKLLGSDWHKTLSESYEEFKDKGENWGKSEETLKEEFKKQTLDGFYDAMGYVFRESFGTDSKNAQGLMDGLKGLFSDK